MRGIMTCCPEPVQTINIMQNVVEMDGTRAFWVDKYYTGAEYNAATGFILDYVPYARSQVTVMVNTGVMRYGFDFTVNAAAVFLTFVPNAEDKINIRYFALTDSTSSVLADSTLATGMIMGYGGSDIPGGWLDMDGVTSRSGAGDNAALFAWLATRSADFCTAYDAEAVTFTLKKIETPYYNGTTLVTGKTLIKL